MADERENTNDSFDSYDNIEAFGTINDLLLEDHWGPEGDEGGDSTWVNETRTILQMATDQLGDDENFLQLRSPEHPDSAGGTAFRSSTPSTPFTVKSGTKSSASPGKKRGMALLRSKVKGVMMAKSFSKQATADAISLTTHDAGRYINYLDNHCHEPFQVAALVPPLAVFMADPQVGQSAVREVLNAGGHVVLFKCIQQYFVDPLQLALLQKQLLREANPSSPTSPLQGTPSSKASPERKCSRGGAGGLERAVATIGESVCAALAVLTSIVGVRRVLDLTTTQPASAEAATEEGTSDTNKGNTVTLQDTSAVALLCKAVSRCRHVLPLLRACATPCASEIANPNNCAMLIAAALSALQVSGDAFLLMGLTRCLNQAFTNLAEEIPDILAPDLGMALLYLATRALKEEIEVGQIQNTESATTLPAAGNPKAVISTPKRAGGGGTPASPHATARARQSFLDESFGVMELLVDSDDYVRAMFSHINKDSVVTLTVAQTTSGLQTVDVTATAKKERVEIILQDLVTAASTPVGASCGLQTLQEQEEAEANDGGLNRQQSEVAGQPLANLQLRDLTRTCSFVLRSLTSVFMVSARPASLDRASLVLVNVVAQSAPNVLAMLEQSRGTGGAGSGSETPRTASANRTGASATFRCGLELASIMVTTHYQGHSTSSGGYNDNVSVSPKNKRKGSMVRPLELGSTNNLLAASTSDDNALSGVFSSTLASAAEDFVQDLRKGLCGLLGRMYKVSSSSPSAAPSSKLEGAVSNTSFSATIGATDAAGGGAGEFELELSMLLRCLVKESGTLKEEELEVHLLRIKKAVLVCGGAHNGSSSQLHIDNANASLRDALSCLEILAGMVASTKSPVLKPTKSRAGLGPDGVMNVVLSALPYTTCETLSLLEELLRMPVQPMFSDTTSTPIQILSEPGGPIDKLTTLAVKDEGETVGPQVREALALCGVHILERSKPGYVFPHAVIKHCVALAELAVTQGEVTTIGYSFAILKTNAGAIDDLTKPMLLKAAVAAAELGVFDKCRQSTFAEIAKSPEHWRSDEDFMTCLHVLGTTFKLCGDKMSGSFLASRAFHVMLLSRSGIGHDGNTSVQAPSALLPDLMVLQLACVASICSFDPKRLADLFVTDDGDDQTEFLFLKSVRKTIKDLNEIHVSRVNSLAAKKTGKGSTAFTAFKEPTSSVPPLMDLAIRDQLQWLLKELSSREQEKARATSQTDKSSRIAELEVLVDSLKRELSAQSLKQEMRKEQKMEQMNAESEEKIRMQKKLVAEEREKSRQKDKVHQELVLEKQDLQTQVRAANNEVASLRQLVDQQEKRFDKMLGEQHHESPDAAPVNKESTILNPSSSTQVTPHATATALNPSSNATPAVRELEKELRQKDKELHDWRIAHGVLEEQYNALAAGGFKPAGSHPELPPQQGRRRASTSSQPRVSRSPHRRGHMYDDNQMQPSATHSHSQQRRRSPSPDNSRTPRTSPRQETDRPLQSHRSRRDSSGSQPGHHHHGDGGMQILVDFPVIQSEALLLAAEKREHREEMAALRDEVYKGSICMQQQLERARKYLEELQHSRACADENRLLKKELEYAKKKYDFLHARFVDDIQNASSVHTGEKGEGGEAGVQVKNQRRLELAGKRILDLQRDNKKLAASKEEADASASDARRRLSVSEMRAATEPSAMPWAQAKILRLETQFKKKVEVNHKLTDDCVVLERRLDREMRRAATYCEELNERNTLELAGHRLKFTDMGIKMDEALQEVKRKDLLLAQLTMQIKGRDKEIQGLYRPGGVGATPQSRSGTPPRGAIRPASAGMVRPSSANSTKRHAMNRPKSADVSRRRGSNDAGAPSTQDPNVLPGSTVARELDFVVGSGDLIRASGASTKAKMRGIGYEAQGDPHLKSYFAFSKKLDVSKQQHQPVSAVARNINASAPRRKLVPGLQGTGPSRTLRGPKASNVTTGSVHPAVDRGGSPVDSAASSEH